ncbi:MAG: hypothetical protein AAGA21_16360 [Pseudomonadota bacterium]
MPIGRLESRLSRLEPPTLPIIGHIDLMLAKPPEGEDKLEWIISEYERQYRALAGRTLDHLIVQLPYFPSPEREMLDEAREAIHDRVAAEREGG